MKRGTSTSTSVEMTTYVKTPSPLTAADLLPPSGKTGTGLTHVYSPYEAPPRAAQTVATYWKESVMRFWYGTCGGIQFAGAIAVFLYILCYRINGALPWSPVSYSEIISSRFPGPEYQSSRWNPLLGYTVVVIFVGLAYLCALIGPCFRGIAAGSWRHGINGFRTLISIMNDPAILLVVMQVALLQDVIQLYYAILGSQLAQIGFNYLFEKENAPYLSVIRIADRLGEQGNFAERRVVDEKQIKHIATHWTAYIIAWIMLVIKWVPIFVYMIFSAVAFTTASPRDWVVVSIPIVALVYDLVLQFLLGMRYSRERYAPHIWAAKTENWEPLTTILRMILNIFIITAQLIPAAQGF